MKSHSLHHYAVMMIKSVTTEKDVIDSQLLFVKCEVVAALKEKRQFHKYSLLLRSGSHIYTLCDP